MRKLNFRSAFCIFDTENTGNITAGEVPALLRYLNIFVSDGDWQSTLLPELLNGAVDQYVTRAALEAKVLHLHDGHLYEPDTPGTLYAAFRALDKDNLGYIELPKLKSALSTQLSEEELSKFLRLAAPRAFDASQAESPAAQRVHYADYIALMTRFK